MKLTKDTEILGLPNNFKFGIEIEADNVKTYRQNGLYTKESAKYIKDMKWHMANPLEESLVGEGGAELVSPVLRDTPETWKSIKDICNHIKKYPRKEGQKVEANEKCGLHIHFDSNCLTDNPNTFKTFMRMYAESEELLYKMCNEKNDALRKGAINNNLKSFTGIIASSYSKGMASPTSQKILEKIQNGTLKVSYKKFGKLKSAIGKLKLDNRRYHGLNLTNIGNPNKNTIEFRMANGTLDSEVIKQNVFLYASLINTSIQATKNPADYEKQLSAFYNTNVTEKEKAQNFLNLIMDNESDRKVYMDRWESVKDAKVFQKNDKKGFAKNRFTKDQFKNIAVRTPANRVQATFYKLKEMLSKTKDKGVEKNEYDR